MAAKRSTKRSTTRKSAAKSAARGANKKKAPAKKGKTAARSAKAASKPAKKAAVKRPAALKAKPPAAPKAKPPAAPKVKPPAAPKAKPPAPPKAASSSVASRFVWVDLMTKDLGAAQSFYKQLFGWGTRDVDVAPPMNKYTMFTSNNEDFGGLVPLQDPNTPIHWLPYVWVEDVDRVAKRTESLGGRVLMQPMDIPNVGRFSVIADPTGGIVSPMSFLQPPKPQPKFGLVGPVAWCELLTDDTAKAGAFYKDLFGWGSSEMDMGPAGKYTVFKSGDRDAGGMGGRPPVLDRNAWITYFAVDDVDARHEAAKAAGARQLVPPDNIPNIGRFSWLADPQGALFALFKGSPPA